MNRIPRSRIHGGKAQWGCLPTQRQPHCGRPRNHRSSVQAPPATPALKYSCPPSGRRDSALCRSFQSRLSRRVMPKTIDADDCFLKGSRQRHPTMFRPLKSLQGVALLADSLQRLQQGRCRAAGRIIGARHGNPLGSRVPLMGWDSHAPLRGLMVQAYPQEKIHSSCR